MVCFVYLTEELICPERSVTETKGREALRFLFVSLRIGILSPSTTLRFAQDRPTLRVKGTCCRVSVFSNQYSVYSNLANLASLHHIVSKSPSQFVGGRVPRPEPSRSPSMSLYRVDTEFSEVGIEVLRYTQDMWSGVRVSTLLRI